jgi:hypothetical protein
MMNLAPLIIFGYDRPIHISNMIHSLSKNSEAIDSEAFIFIDGANDDTDIEAHQKVINKVSEKLPFKKTHVNVRKDNFGCKKNIIEGISDVLDTRNHAIILEDDLMLGKHFLNYMNNSLNMYKDHPEIWHINGYSLPQFFKNSKKSSISTLVQPWGWGTWSDRWDVFIKNRYYEKNLISDLNPLDRKRFNFYNLATYWENALKLDEIGSNSIWDAYWYQTIFLNKGMTLFPQVSHVQNMGFDGTGLHCGEENIFKTEINKRKTVSYPTKYKESKIYKLNAYIFYLKINISNYIKFHKPKFKNLKSISTWVYSKFQNN